MNSHYFLLLSNATFKVSSTYVSHRTESSSELSQQGRKIFETVNFHRQSEKKRERKKKKPCLNSTAAIAAVRYSDQPPYASLPMAQLARPAPWPKKKKFVKSVGELPLRKFARASRELIESGENLILPGEFDARFNQIRVPPTLIRSIRQRDPSRVLLPPPPPPPPPPVDALFFFFGRVSSRTGNRGGERERERENGGSARVDQPEGKEANIDFKEAEGLGRNQPQRKVNRFAGCEQ